MDPHINQRIFELKAVLFFLLLLLLVLGAYSDRKIRENKSLKQEMEHMEKDIEAIRQQNLLKIDSLQVVILAREQIHRQLKDSLALLEKQRNKIKKLSDENKAAINRIADVDSLYDEVARHYRPH